MHIWQGLYMHICKDVSIDICIYKYVFTFIYMHMKKCLYS